MRLLCVDKIGVNCLLIYVKNAVLFGGPQTNPLAGQDQANLLYSRKMLIFLDALFPQKIEFSSTEHVTAAIGLDLVLLHSKVLPMGSVTP